jgi:hypothetical protein
LYDFGENWPAILRIFPLERHDLARFGTIWHDYPNRAIQKWMRSLIEVDLLPEIDKGSPSVCHGWNVYENDPSLLVLPFLADFP